MKSIGIYIHIPFCQKKCLYCDFNSYSGKGHLITDYVEGLRREIQLHRETFEDYEAGSIYIGGGTPSILSGKELETVMTALREGIRIASDAEITMEANPGTLSRSKLSAYFNAGVNRLSMGLQACQEELLRGLGRIHSYRDFVTNLEDARSVGFRNINADLMFALPGQRLEDWQSSLMQLTALEIPHISAYSLIWEAGTAFEGLREKNLLKPIEEDIELEMFHAARGLLQKKGYSYYEISNYAKPGFECKHNIVYWKNQCYIGLGAGAHSYFNNKRYHNQETIEAYLSCINEEKSPIKNILAVSKNDEISETMFLGLRLIDGMAVEEFKNRFGVTPLDIYPAVIPKLQRDGLIIYDNKRIVLTTKGVDLANIVFQELLL